MANGCLQKVNVLILASLESRRPRVFGILFPQTRLLLSSVALSDHRDKTLLNIASQISAVSLEHNQLLAVVKSGGFVDSVFVSFGLIRCFKDILLILFLCP